MESAFGVGPIHRQRERTTANDVVPPGYPVYVPSDDPSHGLGDDDTSTCFIKNVVLVRILSK